MDEIEEGKQIVLLKPHIFEIPATNQVIPQWGIMGTFPLELSSIAKANNIADVVRYVSVYDHHVQQKFRVHFYSDSDPRMTLGFATDNVPSDKELFIPVFSVKGSGVSFDVLNPYTKFTTKNTLWVIVCTEEAR